MRRRPTGGLASVAILGLVAAGCGSSTASTTAALARRSS
jgi:hypothetical protein